MNDLTRSLLRISRQTDAPSATKVCLWMVILVSLVCPSIAHAQSSNLVISQFYGAGGEAGAAFRQDYVQLFNAGDAPVDLSGWTVQTAMDSESAWRKAALSGIVEAGAYYLVQLNGGLNGPDLPAPDFVANLDLESLSGRVALVSSDVLLDAACPARGDVVDFVLYGSPYETCSDGGAATFLTVDEAAFRARQGCQDTDNSASDFVTGPPAPFNSLAPRNSCDSQSRCSLSVAAVRGSLSLAGGSGIIEVFAPAGCAWIASPLDDWIVITSGRTGGGSGSISYRVTAHDRPQGRSGGVTFTGAPLGSGFGYAPVEQVGAHWGSSGAGDAIPSPADYDGDGSADMALYRTATGEWTIFQSSDAGLRQVLWGAPSMQDLPMPSDYDGDGRADVAVYRRKTGEWFINPSSQGPRRYLRWGSPALDDRPVPADYDADVRTDVAVYRPSTGEWLILQSSDGRVRRVSWGAAATSFGDRPVPADYDGDGRTDLAVYRSTTGEWFILRSSDGARSYARWGAPVLQDMPVPADYDGDGRADIAVFRLVSGDWWILRSSDAQLDRIPYGLPLAGDVPVPADYAGTGTSNLAVWRQSDGSWFVRP